MDSDRGDNYEWRMSGIPAIREPQADGCVFRGIGYSVEMQWEGIELNDASFVDQYESKGLVPLCFDDNPRRVIVGLDMFQDNGVMATCNGHQLRVYISGYESHAPMTYEEMFKRMDEGTVFMGTFPIRPYAFNKLGSNIYHLFPRLRHKEKVPNHLVTFVGHGKKNGYPFLLFPNACSPDKIGRVYFTEVYQVPNLAHFRLISVKAGPHPGAPQSVVVPPPQRLLRGPSRRRPPSESRGRPHPYDRAQPQRGHQQEPQPTKKHTGSAQGRHTTEYVVAKCGVATSRDGISLAPYEYRQEIPGFDGSGGDAPTRKNMLVVSEFIGKAALFRVRNLAEFIDSVSLEKWFECRPELGKTEAIWEKQIESDQKRIGLRETVKIMERKFQQLQDRKLQLEYSAEFMGETRNTVEGPSIFLIGGHNGYTWSLQQSRFTTAAAELNGALYVVGGYEFSNDAYLQSVERYDPREGFWTQVASMGTKRACHSVSVLGESLYALGGYDGNKMVSTVEIFDPRANSWRISSPFSVPRGYGCAIGGLDANEENAETVEVYSESQGWSIPGYKAIGQRRFTSAIAF